MSAPDHRPVLVVLAAGRARRYGGCKPLAPVGPGGEGVIDLLVSDALSAGFGPVVLVVSPSTGPAIRYHVGRCWPDHVDVRFAVQEEPLGTAHAVVAASPLLPEGRAVGVANADDVYGEGALGLLATYLRDHPRDNALVGFRLRNAVVGTSPVTRGVCEVGEDGMLASIDERRQVAPTGDGRFVAGDGCVPAEIGGDTLVSMNLWGLGPAMLGVLAERVSGSRAGGLSQDAEILLPEVVGDLLAAARDGAAGGAGRAGRFAVLAAEGRCIGVTHPDDLALVQAALARQVGGGERPAQLWTAPVP